jgi:hypothetical protein
VLCGAVLSQNLRSLCSRELESSLEHRLNFRWKINLRRLHSIFLIYDGYRWENRLNLLHRLHRCLCGSLCKLPIGALTFRYLASDVEALLKYLTPELVAKVSERQSILNTLVKAIELAPSSPRYGLLLQIQRCRPPGFHLCWQGQRREYAAFSKFPELRLKPWRWGFDQVRLARRCLVNGMHRKIELLVLTSQGTADKHLAYKMKRGLIYGFYSFT